MKRYLDNQAMNKLTKQMKNLDVEDLNEIENMTIITNNVNNANTIEVSKNAKNVIIKPYNLEHIPNIIPHTYFGNISLYQYVLSQKIIKILCDTLTTRQLFKLRTICKQIKNIIDSIITVIYIKSHMESLCISDLQKMISKLIHLKKIHLYWTPDTFDFFGESQHSVWTSTYICDEINKTFQTTNRNCIIYIYTVDYLYTKPTLIADEKHSDFFSVGQKVWQLSNVTVIRNIELFNDSEYGPMAIE